MKRKLPVYFAAAAIAVVGFIALTTTGCEAPSYSTNDSDRPWNETRGFQHQGGSRNDR